MGTRWPLDGPPHEHGRSAPGELELVRRFINSVDLEGGPDELRDPSSAAGWLRDHGLSDAEVEIDDDVFSDLVALRESLRELTLANHDRASSSHALEAIARIGRGAHLVVGADKARLKLVPAGDRGRTAIARVLAIVMAAQESGTWGRLKACRRDTCRWAFYDHSKNRSGSWCSMGVCGNREKAKRFRTRHVDSEEQN